LRVALIEGIPVLVLPIIILGGIYGGVFTPTEAAAVAAIYTCVASLLLKDISLKDVPKIVIDSAKMTAQLMIIVASAAVFAQAALVAQVPAAVTAAFSEYDKYTFLIMLNLLLLIVGCFFDVGGAILILSPLLIPTALALGIDPIHLGIVFVVNLAIGLFTPPFGLVLFAMQGTLNKKMSEIAIACIPYFIIYFACCLVITFIPEISMILPRLLM